MCKGTNKLHKKWTRKTRVPEKGNGGRRDEGGGGGRATEQGKEIRSCGSEVVVLLVLVGGCWSLGWV